MLRFLFTTIMIMAASNLNASQQLPRTVDNTLQSIEDEYHIKVGVYALDTNNGRVIARHENERFPFQSTCKFIGVAALLAKDTKGSLLQKKVLMQPQDILFWHPISGRYVNKTVSLQTLAEGAISYSDNPAINKIIKEIGGLKFINQFAHDIGNLSYKMEHYEVDLNSNPHQEADTSTPKDMALSVQKILLGEILNPDNRELLLGWMKNNTTGYKRIRAGVPLGWTVADKTGSGSYGIANDVGIAWSLSCKPIILSIFTISNKSDAKPNDETIAKITGVLFNEFEQHHPCYQATHLGGSA